MRDYIEKPKFEIRFVNEWPDRDINFTFFVVDIAVEGGYPRLYVGLLGFLLEVGFEGYC